MQTPPTASAKAVIWAAAGTPKFLSIRSEKEQVSPMSCFPQWPCMGNGASLVTRQRSLEDTTTADSRVSWAALTSSLQFWWDTVQWCPFKQARVRGLSGRWMGQRGGGNTAGGGYRVFFGMSHMRCELYLNKAIILKYQHKKGRHCRGHNQLGERFQ